MSSNCLCFELNNHQEYDLWRNTHLPSPNRPWQSCYHCQDTCYKRKVQEDYKLFTLQMYQKRKQKTQQQLDSELEKYFNDNPLVYGRWS